MIDRLQGFFGFTRTPFGRDLAPSMLHRHTSHGEAVARIGWYVTERRIGVITGEVGAGRPSRSAPPYPPTLSGADLSNADCSQANLTQAILTAATLRGESMPGADLAGLTVDATTDMSDLRWDSETV